MKLSSAGHVRARLRQVARLGATILIGAWSTGCGPGGPGTPSGPQLIDANIDTDTTLTDLRPGTVPDYEVSGCLAVSANLVVDPGVVIEFQRDGCLIVGNATGQGSLSAVGSAAAPIVFRGKTQSAGFWKGIAFGSASTANELNRVTVADAGSGSMGVGYEDPASVRISFSGRLKIANATFTDGAAAGIQVTTLAGESPQIPAFSGNTFEGNAGAAMVLPAAMLGVPDGASTFAGNTAAPYVSIVGGPVGDDLTIHALDVPYQVTGDVGISGNVVVEAGAQLAMARDSAIHIGNPVGDGSFHAVGTAAAPIVITGVVETAGSWRGINFATASTANELGFAEIAYGGGPTVLSDGSEPTNIGVDSGSRLVMNSSTVRDSAGWGVFLHPANPGDTKGALQEAGNTYSGNATGDVSP